MVSRLTRKIMPEEEATDRVQYTTGHLHHVLHNLLHGCFRDRHIHRANSNHKIETRNDIASILYKFVEVGKMVSALDVCVV